jgi:hypothetical protein
MISKLLVEITLRYCNVDAFSCDSNLFYNVYAGLIPEL